MSVSSRNQAKADLEWLKRFLNMNEIPINEVLMVGDYLWHEDRRTTPEDRSETVASIASGLISHVQTLIGSGDIDDLGNREREEWKQRMVDCSKANSEDIAEEIVSLAEKWGIEECRELRYDLRHKTMSEEMLLDVDNFFRLRVPDALYPSIAAALGKDS